MKKGILSFHFKYNKTDYRIAYLIERNEIHILPIGTRENFYKELTQIL
ncbi:MAG: type II toxin-antitoxin system RelE/ParE family toxin [Leptospiraceae bacterium]|nr:type II toxin-antitoxin system RelE/ParE family toxin [Leptospiraceae bacterium]MBK9503226.1 type II toxin-antitoxin system RelE/ParE family toxin [Leptospiraceae bacterium]MBL0266491.1 type II toxin-antitoxin system RelE/ParE family toxin [Leptospiraceae bacterium]MBP9162136.1 type II toxin-antitoxin system RelE/ParE family toxin [Leptospiraceae bacterium]